MGVFDFLILYKFKLVYETLKGADLFVFKCFLKLLLFVDKMYVISKVHHRMIDLVDFSRFPEMEIDTTMSMIFYWRLSYGWLWHIKVV